MQKYLKFRFLMPFFCTIVTILLSCTRKNNQYTAYEDGYKLFNLEQAGWKSMSMTHRIDNIYFKATLVPIQYYILKNEGIQGAQTVDSIYLAHNDERIVEMEFQNSSNDDLLKNKYTRRDYQSAVEYMAFQIEKDFKVITQSGDTIACAGVTFERNFKIAPFKRLLLHFGGVPEDEDVRLLYQDNLFGKGILEYKFNEAPLKL